MRILVVLVECNGADATVPVAVKHAAPQQPVTVLQVFDPRYTERLCRKLRQDGWMGASASQEVGDKIRDEYHQRFDTACSEVVSAIKSQGVQVDLISREGDLVNTVLQTMEELKDVQRVLVGHPQRSWLSRWLDDLNLRVLIDKAPCEVQLVELPR